MRDERAPSRGVSVTRRGLFVLTGSAAVLLAASCGEDPDRTTWTRGADSLPDRQVWAHMVPQGLPLSEDPQTHYGSERPLFLAPAGTPYPQLVQSQLDQARAAGLTGMQILLLEDVNSGDDFVTDWMAAADPTWQDGARGFAVAACIQVTSRSGAESLIREYVAAAKDRPSAARIDDALVVWVYDARALSPDDWLACRRGLERDGIAVYVVAELRTAASQNDNAFDAAAVDPYAGLFEAVWLFDDHDSMILPDVARWAREHDTAFAGGILPDGALAHRDAAQDGGSQGDPCAVGHGDGGVVELEGRVVRAVAARAQHGALRHAHVRADRDGLQVEQPCAHADPRVLAHGQFPRPVDPHVVADQCALPDLRAEGPQDAGAYTRRAQDGPLQRFRHEGPRGALQRSPALVVAAAGESGQASRRVCHGLPLSSSRK